MRAFGRWFTKNANEDEEAVPLVPLKGKDLERNALASRDSSPADRAPGRTSRTCLGYQDRERGSYLGKSRTGPAMTLGSPLVRFAASPLPP